MDTKVIKPFLILIAVVLTSINTWAQASGTIGGGGGDMCENRIQIIRNDIKDWIFKGGHKDLKKLPAQMSHEEYKKNMLYSLQQTQFKCVGIGDVGYPVEIYGKPKTCAFDNTTNPASFRCDFLKFNTTSESEQYVLVHHEFAGPAGVELPDGAVSYYDVSNEITDYLESTIVKKLAVKKTASDRCANPIEINLDSEGKVKIRFCEIPAAQGVLIGSENGDANEKPVKPRNFKKFQMAQFEVTQLQYKTMTGSEPWKENGKLKDYVQESNNNPAVYVSYNDAVSFARILSLIDKTATYRLPTEAEFEYAARAGTTTNYFWGEEMDSNFAYFRGNTETSGKYKYARKVDSCPNPILNQSYPGYCANNFGLYHMLGNVWEWTADAYKSNYSDASTDGNIAVVVPSAPFRVLRGSSWFNSNLQSFRSANRFYDGSAAISSDIGFRLVRIPK